MTSETPDTTPRATTGRWQRAGWATTLLAGGAVAGAVLTGNLPAFATTSPSPSGSSATGVAGDGANDAGDRDGDRRGGHDEAALTGATADKVKAAALAKVPGATVVRLEKDSDGAVYEALLTKADGSAVTVKLNARFVVTGVETGGMRGGGHDGDGPGRGHDGNGPGRGHDEVAVSAADAAKVKAAAVAKYPGATVDRVEGVTGAGFEAHVTKADGTRVEVLLDAAFAVTGEETGH